MTIVVKKVPKCLKGIVKILFGIKEKWYEKKGYSYSLFYCTSIYNNSLIKL